MRLLPSFTHLPPTAAPGPATPQPGGTPPAPTCPALSEAELLADVEAHYPALLRFCRAEGVGYVLCGHVAAAEGAAVRFALGRGWVMLRLRPDGQFGLTTNALTPRQAAYLVSRALPVRERRVLKDGPWPEGRQWGRKWAADQNKLRYRG